MNVAASEGLMGRQDMIQCQLKPVDVLDPKILSAFAAVDRHLFVPELFQAFTYSEQRIPLGVGDEVMLTPAEIGQMIQALNIQPNWHVLEVGTGSGYMSAVLAQLSAQVTTLEIDGSLAQRAKDRFKKMHLSDIKVLHKNALLADFRPQSFDAIVVTASMPAWPEPLKRWTKVGGAMMGTIGRTPVMTVYHTEQYALGKWQTQAIFDTDIPMLKGLPTEDHFVF